MHQLAFCNVGQVLPSQSQELLSLLLFYSVVFAENPHDVGRTKKHSFTFTQATQHQSVNIPGCIPAACQQEMQSLIQDMLKNDTIQPPNSPWVIHIVLVQKKDESLRFSIDYRKLNAVTCKDSYPLPRVDDTLDTLADSHWFTTMDLISEYILAGRC